MRFDEKTIDGLADLLAEVAAQEIMPRFRRLEAGDIRQKTSATDLVTEADVNAERVITQELIRRYPGALVVGEEACEEDRSLVGKLPGAELAFVLDPVDGTFNFASGVPLFGVMLAVVVKGETVAGIIYDPVGNDWLIGAKGAGSRIRIPGGASNKVQVADSLPISEMTGAISWQFQDEPRRSRTTRNMAKFRAGIAYRSAAHEYRIIASGHVHFACFDKLMPWDHLAGVLIHQESGGHAARLDGSAYLPGHTDGGLLVAPDPQSWEAIRQAILSED